MPNRQSGTILCRLSIQEVNIRRGLFGLEDSQGAISADYAFGQFRFLTKLWLVHGQWSYQRACGGHTQ
ncbi:hypothetical protein EV360DRAFT_54880 [Lentinula raphanica]|nr:hypothetical protein EV360DRAFT_54880 [Lentinula raphanica]